MFRGEFGDPPALEEGERVGQDNERVGSQDPASATAFSNAPASPASTGSRGDPQRAGRGPHLLHSALFGSKGL